MENLARCIEQTAKNPGPRQLYLFRAKFPVHGSSVALSFCLAAWLQRWDDAVVCVCVSAAASHGPKPKTDSRVGRRDKHMQHIREEMGYSIGMKTYITQFDHLCGSMKRGSPVHQISSAA
jgi:hypothetical protein